MAVSYCFLQYGKSFKICKIQKKELNTSWLSLPLVDVGRGLSRWTRCGGVQGWYGEFPVIPSCS